MVKLIHPLCILGQLQLLCLCLSSAISLFPSATTAVPLPIEGSTLPPLPENQSDLAVQVFNISSRTIGSASDPQSTTLYYATCLSAVDPIKKEGLEKHSTPILGWLSYDPARYLSLQAVDGAIEAPKECPSSKFAIIKCKVGKIRPDPLMIMELKNSIWARFVNDIIRVRGMKSNRDDSNVSGTTRILQNYDVIIA
ncbi:hypothetical protein J3R30DRAFT_3406745 [Lentinula aciculospora]|uniref:Uncharacterized protein n=1 Tax=Lentinula aciculospora TaxID=153920 RepID=A0A9W9A3D4_9AGAR|nr:hypothetical protein J3R30DRAFT_3406745 [Lentinula aciculospora]